MNLGILSWLTRLLWTPKPTRDVVGVPRSISERVGPSLAAITIHTPEDDAEEIRDEIHQIFREAMEERQIPGGTYEILIETELGTTVAQIRRISDARVWSLSAFDDFVDLEVDDEPPDQSSP